MTDQTERQIEQFPDFDDLESVECEGSFKIWRDAEKPNRYHFYFYGDRARDFDKMTELCPHLAEILAKKDSYPSGSAFSFMDDKLAAFGLFNVGYFILEAREYQPRLLSLSPDLGGTQKRLDQYGAKLTFFEVECSRDTAEGLYRTIVRSKCGQEMDKRCWRFGWRYLPGGPEPKFIVFERTSEAGYAFDLPVTDQRLIDLCPDCLAVNYGTDLQLCVDAGGERFYIIIHTDTVGNLCVPLDSERYYVKFLRD